MGRSRMRRHAFRKKKQLITERNTNKKERIETRSDMEQELTKKKDLLKRFGSKLHDKGDQIRKQIEDMEHILKKMSIQDEPKVKHCDSQREEGDVLVKVSDSNVPSDDNISKSDTNLAHSINKNNKSTVAKLDTKTMECSAIKNDRITDMKLVINAANEQTVKKCDTKSFKCSIDKDKPAIANTKASIGKNENKSIMDKDGKSNSEDISFTNLRIKYEKSKLQTDKTKSFPQSPSFMSYRSNDKQERSSKLTEARALPSHLLGNKLKYLGAGLGSSSGYGNTVSSQIKETAVENIHNSLKSCPSELEETQNPQSLTTCLMSHQKRALSWLLWRESQEPRGGIFADDMGLGKTLTIIALVLKDIDTRTISDSKENRATLVVCPASLMHQWKAEVIKHCKKQALKILIHHGTKRETSISVIKDYDIVLTTYNLVLSEGKAKIGKKKEAPLFEINWHRIVLDEAHTIKNFKSQTAEFVFKLSSDIKWAVTGTPIHNDLKDIYGLLKFLQCKPFDDYTVWKKLINDFSETSILRRNALIKSILFRRCKNQKDNDGAPLVKLPSKHMIIHEVKLTDVERAIYDEIYTEMKIKIGDYLIQKSPEKKHRNMGSAFLTLLLKLQQCCNHPSLIKAPTKDDTVSDPMSDLLSDLSSLNISESSSDASSESDAISKFNIDLTSRDISFPKSDPSAKVGSLIKKVVKIVEKNEKMVIVSQWVSMLDVVALHLEQSDIEFLVIKGSTKPEERNLIAEDFNTNAEGKPVLLLSLKAGGVGLNLVGGNHMFLVDLHWNPALEDQACDRIYRVGQQRDVYIHKFVCKETIEEKIVKLQTQKKSLAKNVLDGAKNNCHMSIEDLRQLFS